MIIRELNILNNFITLGQRSFFPFDEVRQIYNLSNCDFLSYHKIISAISNFKTLQISKKC